MINKERQKRKENPRIQNSERYHQITHEARWIEKHYTKQFRKQANNSIQCIAIKSKEKNNAEKEIIKEINSSRAVICSKFFNRQQISHIKTQHAAYE